jgi:hypothetical protein
MLMPEIRSKGCSAEEFYLGALASGSSRAHPPPRYGRIWPRSHMRGTCITPERLIGCGMGDVVNLRRARKKAERQLAERTASANRLRHGRSQAERELEAKRDAKARRDLNRHRTERGDER